MLSAHLWDLRAQAEAKLRCLTRLQQQLTAYEATPSASERIEKYAHILADLTDIVTISATLHDVARLALRQAKQLS